MITIAEHKANFALRQVIRDTLRANDIRAGRGFESAEDSPVAQLELFPSVEEEPVSFAPSVESVRARIEAVLVRLREAKPCSAKESALWRVVIPQMANWLPPEERDAKRLEFARLIGALERPAPVE